MASTTAQMKEFMDPTREGFVTGDDENMEAFKDLVAKVLTTHIQAGTLAPITVECYKKAFEAVGAYVDLQKFKRPRNIKLIKELGESMAVFENAEIDEDIVAMYNIIGFRISRSRWPSL